MNHPLTLKFCLLAFFYVMVCPIPSYSQSSDDEFKEARRLIEDGQYEKGVPMIRALAEKGNDAAQVYYGWMFETGTGVEIDYEKAFEWYHFSAEQGNVTAMCNMGLAYEYARGVKKDLAEALKWYKKASEMGNTRAQYRVGLCYAYGRSIPQDYAEAAVWIKKAADGGYVSAIYHYGWLYENGEGVKKDLAEALKWYRKASEKGDFGAQYKVGLFYAEGKSVPQDYAEAAVWMKKAADGGNRSALVYYGWLLEKGYGVEKDAAKAREMYLQAANKGNMTAKRNLAIMYRLGVGGDVDYVESLKWYKSAAEEKTSNHYSNNCYWIGYMYEQGKGVAVDLATALGWYEKGAEAGDINCQTIAGYMYLVGQGTAVNIPKALKWLELAADQGSPAALHNLGFFFYTGHHIREDQDKGIDYFRQAASKGFVDSYYALGSIMMNRLKEMIERDDERDREVSVLSIMAGTPQSNIDRVYNESLVNLVKAEAGGELKAKNLLLEMLDISDDAAYDIGEVNASLGYYQSAIEWYKLSRITPGVSYSKIYKSMADAYALSGDFDNYVHMLDRIALLNDAASSNYLGDAYYARGDYQKAIEYDKMAIDYSLANDLKLAWLSSLNNEASAHVGLGDYASAKVLLDHVDAYMSDFDNMWVGMASPNLVRTVYGTKAVLYRKMGDRVGAYETIARMEFSVLGVGADIQGFKPSAENVSTLSELGLWYSMQEVPVEAVVDRIESDKFILDNMKSLVKQSCEKYTPKEKAELYVGKVIATCESVPHPFLRAQLEMDAAYTMHNLGEYDKASNLFRKSFPMMLDYLASQYSTMSENSRSNLFERSNLDIVLPLVASSECHASSGGDFGFLYDVNLFFKGFLLQLSDNFNDIIHKSSPELQEKFTTLKSLQQQIVADKANRPEEEVAIKEKEAKAEKLEMELVSKSKSFGSFVKDMRLTWRDVAESMGERDLAVEFMDYPVDGGKDRRYIALLLRKGDTSPKMVQLCLESEMTALTRGGVNTTYSPKGNSVALFNLIWSPLSQYMVSGENIYFAPSGELYKIAVESLYMPDGGLVSSRYNLHRISSTRIICKPQQTVRNASAVLYGGLKYDLNDKELSRASEQTRGEDYVIDGIDNSRGLVLAKDAISAGKSWTYLPGTMKEVQNIGSVMKSKGLMVKSLSGSEGNEESFRKLSGNSPDILHIATHGFYSRRLAKGDDSPMSSSGLVLSGANLKWISGQVPDGVEDGLLYANEIARLDLDGTDLVVLSACDTGLGEISGEGVSGLQRGFKQAGVNSIMMTLSKVEDDATALMMKTFYTNLLSGRTRLDSFKAAQSAVRDAYQEPKYWAPFILLEN